MGIRRSEGSFEGEAGRKLFRRAWLPEDPERLLIVVHGFAEHSGRYEGFGSWFAARGTAVHAFDHQGHGHSRGRRNHVERFEHYLDDLAQLLAIARAESPELPCTLVGHSMGGLISTAFAIERRPDVLALVTSGPALSLGPSLSRTKMLFARLLRRLAPKLALDAGLPLEGLSRDDEVIRRYVEDPLVTTKVTASLVVEMMDAATRTASRAADVELPMLMLHGEDDSLCPPQGSRAFYRSLCGVSAEASALRIYPGLRHEIFNEPEREEVFADLLEWVRAREHASGFGRAQPAQVTHARSAQATPEAARR